MPRKKRPLERSEGVDRDASIIVIACEDKYAPKVYFGQFVTSRVQFKVFPTEDCRSSPFHIVQRLRTYQDEFQLGGSDQLWYLGDLDHWSEPNHIANLTPALRECRQADFGVAICNPCFELWLLLHFVDLPKRQPWNATTIESELRRQAGGYSKVRGCVTPITSEMVEVAIERDRALDEFPVEDIPRTPTSRVSRIIEVLKQKQAIRLLPTAIRDRH